MPHPTMTAQQLGYWFEDQVRDTLKEIQRTYPSMFHRFTDSKAARNTVAAQPGDHMWLVDGKAFLIEEKASKKYKSLRSCLTMVSDKQIAFHRKWIRSGNPTLVLFYSDLDDTIEIWKGMMVAEHRVAGKPIPKTLPPLYRCKMPEIQDALLRVKDVL